MIEIIDAPFDLCGRTLGSRLGPIAVHLAGLESSLRRLGREVYLSQEVWPLTGNQPENPSEIPDLAIEAYGRLRDHTRFAIRQGRMPIVLGGDHSLAIGSVSGAMDAVEGKLAVLWIDAHMDLNTPATSETGNLHGMPLAALNRLGEGTPGPWSRILADCVPPTALNSDAVAWLGLRDVDDGEVANLRLLPGANAVTMQDVDERGLTTCLTEILARFQQAGATHLWISFDVDSIDPFYAPGTGTKVRGGFTYREGHLIAEWLHRALFGEGASLKLTGLDLVEVNPIQDRSNETARMAVEWASSLFGKQILGSKWAGRVES